jgi:tRNA threonylcarbamoyladenosine biosynthesis protein TsaE
MIIEIKSLEDLPSASKTFLEETDNRKVFAFEGQMGAGKTTFIVSLLKAMGVEDIEGSPTYSLVNTYDSVAFGRINHFDLYRLNSEEEAFDIGIEEMLYGGDYCFIEWPSKIENLLPENTIWVRISINDENERIISVEIE